MEFRTAILITAYNRKDTTAKCLENLIRCKSFNYNNFSIYLVDDLSPDKTGEYIKKLYPEVKVLIGNGELYWNRGMLFAWQEAIKSDFNFFIWLNDDTILYENALIDLFESYSNLKMDGIVIGSTIDPVSNEFSYGGRCKKGIPIIPNGKLQKAQFINGNLVLISKKTYLDIGMLDPNFSHSLGDIDYGLRALKKGIQSYVSKSYIGECRKNKTEAWSNPNVSLINRLNKIGLPNTIVLKEHYYFNKKHKSRWVAVLSILKILLKCILPNTYNRLKKVGITEI